jgi:uncharacterized protein involved in exopolysaccharide biosynthesis
MMGSRSSGGDSLTALAAIVADPAAFQERVTQLQAATVAHDEAFTRLQAIETHLDAHRAELAITADRNAHDARVVAEAQLQLSKDRAGLEALTVELRAKQDAAQAEEVRLRELERGIEAERQKVLQAASTRALQLNDRETALNAREAAIGEREHGLDMRECTLIADKAELDRKLTALRTVMGD